MFGASDLNDDDFSKSTSSTALNIQAKAYAINLNERLTSLYKSRREIQQKIDNEENLYHNYNLLSNINEEINKNKQWLQSLTKGNNKLKGLIDLAYRGIDELDNVDNLLNKELNGADIKYILQTIKFWKGAKGFIFNQTNYNDILLNNKYGEVESKAHYVLERALKVLDNYTLENIVKKGTKFDGTIEDLAKEFVDLTTFRGFIDNLGITNSHLLSAIARKIERQNTIRADELHERLNNFKKIVKDSKSSLKAHSSNSNDLFEIFRQEDSYGRKTRNIVTRQSVYYQNQRKQAFRFLYQKEEKNMIKNAKNALTFLKENTEQVKYDVLFPLDDSKINSDEYKTEYNRLKNLLGDIYFEEWFNNQSKKIKSYKGLKNYVINTITEKYKITEEEINNNNEAYSELLRFEELHSPYLIQTRLKSYNPKSSENPFRTNGTYQSFKYIEDIPKKESTITKNGKEEKINNYDSKFSVIENDKDLYNLYNAITKELREISSYVPFETGERLATNGIPEFKLELYDAIMTDGMGVAKDIFSEQLQNMITTEKYDSRTNYKDILTGKDKKNISLGIHKSDSEISEQLRNRVFEYKVKNDIYPTQEMIDDWKSEITEKYANQMNFDLSEVIQRYITLGVAYKHKAIIEDDLLLAQQTLNNLSEYKRDNKGQLAFDASNPNFLKYDIKEKDESFLNVKKMVDYTYDAVLYGQARAVSSGDTKILNSAEKRHKSYLLQTIEEAKAQIALEQEKDSPNIQKLKELEDGISELERQIDNLGAYKDKEKMWDIPMKITQYKGMGWNIFGGISNMTFGYVANLIEGAGQENYTEEQLRKAYAKTFMNSSLRNLTFNKGNGLQNEALKIRGIMDRYDLMAESGKEYDSLVGKDITEKLKFLSAFNINARTEYINQAPLMLVVFDNTTFEHEGKTYSLYDGFDANGNWNTEEYGAYPQEDIIKAVSKVKKLIQKNHGNYNPMSPMLAKKSAAGRLVLQFRTWMVDAIRNRWFDKNGRYDEDLERIVKGTYISVYDSFRHDFTKSGIGLVLQILRNYIPPTIRNAIGINSSPLEKFLNGNDNIKDYDIANMKRMAMELNLGIATVITIMVARGIAADWDDDDPKKWMLNALLNQATRLRSDIYAYLNPSEYYKLFRDPIPSLKIISDFGKVITAANKTIFDGSPEFEAGVHEGQNRLLRAIFNMIPLLNKLNALDDNLNSDMDALRRQ